MGVPFFMFWLFGHKESRRACSIIDSYLENIAPIEIGQIRFYARRYLVCHRKKDFAKLLKSVDNKTEVLVACVLANIIRREIALGGYHVYRGVLSMTGVSLLAVWNNCMDVIMENGFISADEINLIRSEIKEEINQAG